MKKLSYYIAGSLMMMLLPVCFYASTLITDEQVNTTDMLKYSAESTNDWAGNALAAGDFNNDGYQDMLIGAYQEGTETNDFLDLDNTGAAYLIYGSASLPSSNMSLGNADVKFSGEEAGDQAGYSIASGDINADGIDDVIIGANKAGDSGVYPGKVYVIFGSTSNLSSMTLDAADIIYTAEDGDDRAGSSVATGDVNGDGVVDLLIGAEITDQACYIVNVGSVYVIYGGDAINTGTVSLSMADAQISGTLQSQNFATHMTTGDYNGDGYADIIATSPNYGTDLDNDYHIDLDNEDMGAVYIIYGQETLITDGFLGTFNPCESAPVNTLNVDFELLVGEDENDFAGYSIAAGDINDDGYDDVLIGAYGRDDNGYDNSGGVYLLYGNNNPTPETSLANHFLFYTTTPSALGASVAIGDVNNDGKGDMLLGASLDMTGGTGTGGAYLLLSPESGDRPDPNISENNDVQFIGEAPDLTSSLTGSAVAINDFDNNGYGEVWIGAQTYYDEDLYFSELYAGRFSGRIFMSTPYGSDEITSATQDEGDILLSFKDGRETTLTPFAGKKKFKFEISVDNKRLIATNGKLVRVFSNTTKVAQEKINKNKPKKKTHIQLKVKQLYSNYESIIVSTVPKNTGKIAVMRLKTDNSITKLKKKSIEINNKEELTLKTKKSKKYILATYGAGDGKVSKKWKLKKKGKLEEIN